MSQHGMDERVETTHRNVFDLENVRWDVSGTEACTDGISYSVSQRLRQMLPGSHLEEKKHSFIVILRSALSNTKRVIQIGRELLKDGINLSRPKSNATGVENTVTR